MCKDIIEQKLSELLAAERASLHLSLLLVK